MQLTGLHHITAVTGRIADNLEFYTHVLGLRLVKRSVNQDDVSAYHLFYADRVGTPGTDMTFFDWPRIGPNRRGTDSIVGTAFRVAGREALDFWARRLASLGARAVERGEFAGRALLAFEDPEGQRLYLVDDQGAPFEGEIWRRSGIPTEFALRGFYSVILSVPSVRELAPVLTDVLSFEEVAQGPWIDGRTEAAIYRTRPGGGPGTEVWLLAEPSAPRAMLGAGGVHHVAFRVSDADIQAAWRAHLARSGLGVTDQIDRFWFRSIYFRVTRGILFEIATDGPGFGVDEDLEHLGESLVLPPFLEPHREHIEAGLVPIRHVSTNG
jgi:glyoxalase family protein